MNFSSEGRPNKTIKTTMRTRKGASSARPSGKGSSSTGPSAKDKSPKVPSEDIVRKMKESLKTKDEVASETYKEIIKEDASEDEKLDDIYTSDVLQDIYSVYGEKEIHDITRKFMEIWDCANTLTSLLQGYSSCVVTCIDLMIDKKISPDVIYDMLMENDKDIGDDIMYSTEQNIFISRGLK